MKKILVILGALMMIGCGKENSSPPPSPPCAGSKLLNEWRLGDGTVVTADAHCTYHERGPAGVYSGTFVDHNKGATRGTATITLDDGRSVTIGYSITEDRYGNPFLVFSYK